MIEVIDAEHAPEEVRAIAPGAPCFIIEDPKGGSQMAWVMGMQEIRRNYLRAENINFTQASKLVGGKIIHVGEKVDPLVASLQVFG